MSIKSLVTEAVRDVLLGLSSITTVRVSERPVDPLLYGCDDLPLVNIVAPGEDWSYEGSQQTRRNYSLTLELLLVNWDQDTLAGVQYVDDLVSEIHVAMHQDITLGGNTISLDLLNARTRSDQEAFPRVIVDLSFRMLEVEGYLVG